MQRYDDRRGSAHERGYGADWRHARRAYLSEHPLCLACLERGDSVPATVVDHIVPHRGDMALFWDVANWQGLCRRHHAIKTAREDGGFGNARTRRST